MAALIAGKWLKLGHYRDKKPVSKNLFLSARTALIRLRHKTLFMGVSAIPYRLRPVAVGRIFFVKVGSVLVGLKLRGKAVVTWVKGAKKGTSTG